MDLLSPSSGCRMAFLDKKLKQHVPPKHLYTSQEINHRAVRITKWLKHGGLTQVSRKRVNSEPKFQGSNLGNLWVATSSTQQPYPTAYSRNGKLAVGISVERCYVYLIWYSYKNHSTNLFITDTSNMQTCLVQFETKAFPLL
jgi:hypothetical protein